MSNVKTLNSKAAYNLGTYKWTKNKIKRFTRKSQKIFRKNKGIKKENFRR